MRSDILNKKIIIPIVIVVVLAFALYFGNMFLFKNVAKDGENGTDVEGPLKVEDKVENEPENTETEEVAIGALAPDFKLKNLEGKEVSLSDYRGKIVLINFWATTCKFCDIEMPDLNEIDKENDDVVVLAVDVMESESKVKSYIDKGGYGFEVVLDEKGEIARKYMVSGFPTTAIVNEEGILVNGIVGMMTRDQMENAVENARGKE